MAPFDDPVVAFASTLAACFASAVVPVVNAEVYVVALGTLAPRALLPALLVAATAAHMAGKALLYAAGRAADRLPPGGRVARRLAAARARLDARRELGGAVVFASALVGLPPFYAVTVASGVMRYSFRRFLAIGFAGRLLRFGALLFLPQLAAGYCGWGT